MATQEFLDDADSLKLAIGTAEKLYSEQSRLYSDVRTKSAVAVSFVSLSSALLARDVLTQRPLVAVVPSLLLLALSLVFAFPGLVTTKRALSVGMEGLRQCARELDERRLIRWQLRNYSIACRLLGDACAFAGRCVTASMGLAVLAVASLAALAIPQLPTPSALLLGYVAGVTVVFAGVLLRNVTTLMGTGGET